MRRSTAPIFAALGDETRLSLASRLARDGPLSLTRLAAETDLTRQAVAKHLQVMERAGLVRSARQGRERRWQLEERPFDDARRDLERIATRWDEALARLKAHVEEE